MNNKDIERLCKRHMAKTLDYLQNAGADDTMIKWVKREFNFLIRDLEKTSKTRDNENAKADN